MSDTPYAVEFAKLKATNPSGDAKRWELACRDPDQAHVAVPRQRRGRVKAEQIIAGPAQPEGIIAPVREKALGNLPRRSYRASEVVFAKAIQQFPDLLRRSCWRTELIGNDPQLAAYGRANRLGLLPNYLRLEAADRLETAAHSSLDVSFFEEEDMLALLSPLRLVGKGMALRTTVLPSIEERINEIAGDADLDEEPDSHFKKLLDILDRVEAIGVDADAATLIEDARDQVRRSVDEIEERKRERDEETDSDTDWTHIVTQKKEDAVASAVPPATRSIFDDVDK